MKTVEELKIQNKQLQAERLAMKGMLESQGVTVNMAVVQKVGERIGNLFREDKSGDYTLGIDKNLASLVQHLQATIDTTVKPKADIVTPTTKSQYESLTRDERTQLIRNLGQSKFAKMLFNLE